MAGIDNNTLLYLRGDSFDDLSLNPKSITNTNVTVVDGEIFGSSYRFAGGESSYIDCNIENLANNFTIEFFFKAENLSNAPHLFVYGKSESNRIIMYILSSTLKFELFNNSSTNSSISFTGLNFSQYNHVAIVCVNNKIKIAVNGKFSSTEIDASLLDKTYSAIRFGKTIYYSNDIYGLLGNMYNIRISNVARYTEDFTPHIQPYSSITINKTNQTDTNIEFNVEKLGQETINKVEVLVNGTVSKTYSDNYDNIDYLIDTELCIVGNNNITIRVAYDDNYTEELLLSYFYRPNPLPLETPLLDTVERVKLLTKSKQAEKTMLSKILTSKNVEVLEEDKMSDLIGKVDYLFKKAFTLDYEYLNKNGTWVNTTKQLIQDGKNGTIGFKIIGRPNMSYLDMDFTKILRYELELDFTDIQKVSWSARKIKDHGNMEVLISNGFTKNDKNIIAEAFVKFHNFESTWTDYEINTENIKGVYKLIFVGGYWDSTGDIASETQYSNIVICY